MDKGPRLSATHSGKPVFSLSCEIAIIAAFLSTPVLLAYSQLHMVGMYAPALANAAALASFFVMITRWVMRASQRLAWLILMLLSAVSFTIRLAHLLLIHFTGKGFTDDVFFHLEPESFRVGWSEYGGALMGGAAAFFLLLSLVMAIMRRSPRSGGAALSVLLLVFGVGFPFTRFASPEHLLVQAYGRYADSSSRVIDDPAESLDVLRSAGLADQAPMDKRRVRARAAEPARSLVLIYLESFNLGLTDNRIHPGLTPHIDRLKERYGYTDSFFASGFVTIEGIVNSQCGVIAPMNRGNDSMMQERGRMRNLPCLGDVLREAGYHQVYLGGAVMSFAGKGSFLAAHGYDEIKGLEYWEENGFRREKTAWGLPDDALFRNALARIRELTRKRTPFNVTLLTLGTHLPGRSYESCLPYEPAPEESFLNAIHCTDQLLGRFVTALEDEHLLENTVVVITADHGVFPTPTMRELFGDMVDDVRLLTIVIDKTGAAAFPGPMASYDLAPRVLDLLQVEHNAVFLLGRSAPGGTRGDPYFLTRFDDYAKREILERGSPVDAEMIADGKWIAIKNNPSGCSGEDVDPRPGTPPLDLGGKCAVVSAINGILRRFDRMEGDGMDHRGEERSFSVEVDESVVILRGGRPMPEGFTRNGHFVHPSRDGVYLMLLDRDGLVEARDFYYANLEEDRKRLTTRWSRIDPARRFLLVYKTRGSAKNTGEIRRFFATRLSLDDMTGNGSVAAAGAVKRGRVRVSDFEEGERIKLLLRPTDRALSEIDADPRLEFQATMSDDFKLSISNLRHGDACFAYELERDEEGEDVFHVTRVASVECNGRGVKLSSDLTFFIPRLRYGGNCFWVYFEPFPSTEEGSKFLLKEHGACR